MTKISKYILILMLLTSLIITQTACSSEAEPVSRDNYFLDTTCNISVYADEGLANEAIDNAYELCAKLEKTLSKTIEVSDVSKINSSNGGWTEVSDYTIELLEKGIEYSEISDGAFDITVGGITGKWDFHAEEPKLPDEAKLREAASHIGYENIEINGNKVRLLDPETELDLGGIAKGYIADKITESLEKDGITSGIVNLGGNIVCIGTKPSGEDFNIGVEAPFSDRTEIVGSVTAANKTLVTSGVYERMFELDGKIYHHILSTETGWPVISDLDSVTLIADKGHSVDCDALSTTCLIKGYKEAKKIIDAEEGIEAVFVLSNGDVKTTEGALFSSK